MEKETGKEEEQTETQTETHPEIPNTDPEELSPNYIFKGTEIGLAIITPKSQGWPEGHLNLRKLREGLGSWKYK